MDITLSQSETPAVGTKRKINVETKRTFKKRKMTKKRVGWLIKRDPFPPINKNINFRYQDTPGYTLNWAGGLSYYNNFNMYPTSLFDYDVSNVVGNKQPLYFDTLFTSTGPYAFYRVTSWKTTVTVVNLSAVPVVVFFGQASITGGTAELDTPTEMQNFPGVKKEFLTEKGGEKCIAKITLYGSLRRLARNWQDSDFVGAYNASPTKNVTQTCLVQSMDGSSSGSCLISVNHEAVADCFVRDAFLS